MRIKEEFKRLGYFWLPSVPDRKAPGTLSISDGGVIELEVAGLFDDSIEALLNYDFQSIERIVGHIEEDGWVTLDDCYCKPGIIRLDGMLKSLIRVNRVFTGVIYDEGESPLFNSLTFSVEGIDEWVGISGFEDGFQLEKDTATISYQLPADISLNLGNDMQLLIMFDWKLPGFPITKEARMSQKIYFKLVSQNARELDEFISVAHKITTFLCLAIDQTVSLDSMEATSDNRRQDIGDGTTEPIPINIYYPSRLYSKEDPRVYEGDMLFGFEQIQNDAEKRIKNWMEIYDKIEPALDLYFLAKMGAQPTSQAKFLALAQSLEACHRRTSDEKQMDESEFKELIDNLIDQCPQERKEWLKGKLQYGNEVSLRHRLKSLIEPFEDVIEDWQKPKGLIDKIVNTRNYLTHYDPSLKSKVADENLESLCPKMELLFQLHILRLIGFNQSDIKAMIPKLRWKLQ